MASKIERSYREENMTARNQAALKMGAPVGHAPVSKTRALTTLSNNSIQSRKDTNLKGNGAEKTTLRQKQIENANKLSRGISVMSLKHKSDKENISSVKQSKVVRGSGQQVVKKCPVLQKSSSVVSLHPLTPTNKVIQECVPRTDAVTEHLEKLKVTVEPKITELDLKDVKHPFLLGGYVQDVYNYLLYLERRQEVREQYITSSHIMTQNMRSLLVDWMFEVQVQFKLLNETIHMSIALLDRFMQDHPHVDKSELQLVGVACILLASKYEEIYPPELQQLVEVSAKTYSKRQIMKMERVIFSSLDYSIGRATPSLFLRRYARLITVTVVPYYFAKYFTDLSLVHYTMCNLAPSRVAAAALCLALYITSDCVLNEIWNPLLQYTSKYTWDVLKPDVIKLAKVVLNAPSSKHQTIPKKYADQVKQYGVSVRPELKSQKLKDLIREEK